MDSRISPTVLVMTWKVLTDTVKKAGGIIGGRSINYDDATEVSVLIPNKSLDTAAPAAMWRLSLVLKAELAL